MHSHRDDGNEERAFLSAKYSASCSTSTFPRLYNQITTQVISLAI